MQLCVKGVFFSALLTKFVYNFRSVHKSFFFFSRIMFKRNHSLMEIDLGNELRIAHA